MSRRRSASATILTAAGRAGAACALAIAALSAAAYAAPALSQTALGDDLKRIRTRQQACEDLGPSQALGTVAAEDRQMAADLLAQADEAALLGDAGAATTLLRRAAALDPASAEVSYRLARGLEESRDATAAAAEYCRFLTLEASGARAEDVLERLGGLTGSAPSAVDARAQAAFGEGVETAAAGDLAGAEAHFTRVVAIAPSWPEPWYNRALVRAQQGDAEGARSDLANYLDLRPGASDADIVRSRIAASQPPPSVPERARLPRSTGFAGNALLPGSGQFRSGRYLMGTVTLGAAAGLVAFGVMSERQVIRCIVVPIGGECPEGQVAGTEFERPYLAAGVGAAALVSLLGALEQQLWYSAAVERTERVGTASGDAARVEVGPAVRGGAEGIDLSLVRMRF